MDTQLLNVIHTGLVNGRVIPYVGPGVLSLSEEPAPIPSAPQALVGKLTAKATVPHKIRNNLTAAAQFIENFKHRKTVSTAMTEAFSPSMPPTALHHYLASLPSVPLWVHAWYDNLPQQALAQRKSRLSQAVESAEGDFLQDKLQQRKSRLSQAVESAEGDFLQDKLQQRKSHLSQAAESGSSQPRDKSWDWGTVQGVSQAEHFGEWVHYFSADGSRREDLKTATSDPPWPTLLYQPMGSVTPAANYLVSDSDYVEVLTEIDIQTPIPKTVQQLRSGRGFVFLGCRFSSQLERIFAQQIIKRSADKHWAVLPEEPTRNERRFLEQYCIQRIDTPLQDWVAALIDLDQSATARRMAAN